jgi:HPt (histidine-containing phosphotransfer) domain-containing protein
MSILDRRPWSSIDARGRRFPIDTRVRRFPIDVRVRRLTPGFDDAADLAARFLDSTPTRWHRRGGPRTMGDAAALRTEAHAIEDGCRQMGAARMRTLAERLEQTTAEDRLAGAAVILEDLDQQFDLVRAVFAGRGLG